MKNLTVLLLPFLLLFFSCTKEEVTKDVASLDREAEESFATDAYQKALKVGGEYYYAGYGYSPTLDRAYRPAVEAGDEFEDPSYGGTSVEVALIKTYNEIDEFVDDGDSTGIDITYFKPLTFGINVKEKLVERLIVSDTTISVIVRIKNVMTRYGTDDAPFLSEQAASILKSGRVDRFLRRYGPAFVRDNIIGGEIYYAYNLDISKMTDYEREEFTQNVNIGVEGIFKFGNNQALTEITKETINKTTMNMTMLCTVPGFPLEMITLDAKAQKVTEVQTNFNEYLLANPEKASTLKMAVLPYASVYEIEDYKLQEAYESEMACYGHWEKWIEVRDRVLFVYENTKSLEMKGTAQNALTEIDVQIANARTCNGASVAPPVDAYYHIVL